MSLFDLIDATWPAAGYAHVGPWVVRDGQGGGNRVSAVSAAGDWLPADIAQAEQALAALSQPPKFMVRDAEPDLDSALDGLGYRITDPVTIYQGDIATLAAVPPPPVSTFPHWPMLEIMREIWADGGIGPARLAVMDRVQGPKCAILGRVRDRAAGAAFVACHGDRAMLHALHVLPGQRRQGTAVHMMRAAAIWAQDVGATQFFVVVTDANASANRLYASLDMQVVGHYHYRSK